MASYSVSTLGDLKKQISGLPSIREEMRFNLIKKLQKNAPLFPEIIGYDETVLPGIINAILCGHNMIVLGERGQGKIRIIFMVNSARRLSGTKPWISTRPLN